jgi:hypothetical protein
MSLHSSKTSNPGNTYNMQSQSRGGGGGLSKSRNFIELGDRSKSRTLASGGLEASNGRASLHSEVDLVPKEYLGEKMGTRTYVESRDMETSSDGADESGIRVTTNIARKQENR